MFNVNTKVVSTHVYRIVNEIWNLNVMNNLLLNIVKDFILFHKVLFFEKNKIIIYNSLINDIINVKDTKVLQ